MKSTDVMSAAEVQQVLDHLRAREARTNALRKEYDAQTERLLQGEPLSVTVWCADNDVEITSRHTSEIKRFATGKGNAGKDEMIDAAREFGAIIDDNHADALWLLKLMEKELGSR